MIFQVNFLIDRQEVLWRSQGCKSRIPDCSNLTNDTGE